MFKGFILHHLLQECQMNQTRLNMIQKVLHHLLKVTLKNQKGNFKIASSLEMLQQVLTSGFTNLEVFLKEVSWTKSPSVTKNNKYYHPLHSFKVITPVYLVLNHSFPSLKCILHYINVEISGELRQTNITSCLVVVRTVDSACFIVCAKLNFPFISSSVDNDFRRNYSNRRLKRRRISTFITKTKKNESKYTL